MFERRRTLRQAESPGKARDFVIRPSAPHSLKHWPARPVTAARATPCGGSVPARSIRERRRRS